MINFFDPHYIILLYVCYIINALFITAGFTGSCDLKLIFFESNLIVFFCFMKDLVFRNHAAIIYKIQNINVMKKNTLHAVKVLLLTVLFYNCQKENVTRNDYKQETDKIETSIATGAQKDRSYITHFPKRETMASKELKQKIMGAMINSYSKTNAIPAVNNEIFGVFKDGSCGSYRELDIRMDCEDNNPASATKGYTGSTSVDNGDIYYQFCLVNDRKRFPQLSSGKYAVLSLDRHQSVNGINVSFDRGFDNEDHNNQNAVELDGQSQPLPFDSFAGVNVTGNAALSFLLILKNSEGPAKPPVLAGVTSYGVLGSFGEKKGNIFSDDEDFQNANSFYSNTASESSVFFKGVIEFGSNTKFYVSKAR